ncbi:hypothetical protein ACH41H_41885 [Streptomyces sp. NPDC020800]|uniref:hypothetical protein n=1 Tax=Streptomyces sp. NPDC020800 TaxID=3365092 RepID=UPI0037AC4C3E
MPGASCTAVGGFGLRMGASMLGHFAHTGLLPDSLAGARAPGVVSIGPLSHRSARLDFGDLMSRSACRAGRACDRSKPTAPATARSRP